MKIMIVDDEVIIRTGLATVIKWQDLGLKLLEPAASAEEAIARIPNEKPDILLTDIRMTGKNGLELAEEAKAILPELDIIILTGFDDFNYTQKAIRQGVNDYLLKTSRPDDIIRTVLRAKQRIWTGASSNESEMPITFLHIQRIPPKGTQQPRPFRASAEGAEMPEPQVGCLCLQGGSATWPMERT